MDGGIRAMKEKKPRNGGRSAPGKEQGAGANTEGGLEGALTRTDEQEAAEPAVWVLGQECFRTRRRRAPGF